ncbi:hypothetical protein GGI07_004878 [Coemansia sp. Benny D115]|nr:hypothetical protein GGI07_004878 [Coemansia sp. Benny D115]
MSAHESTKKSIYDDVSPSTTVPPVSAEEAPTRLLALTRGLRNDAQNFATFLQVHGQIAISSVISLERRVASVIERTVPRGERLAPGIIYVGIAALAGPIFTRRRNFAVRWTSPILFAAAAGAYFLPGTSQVVLRNVWGRYGDPQAVDRLVEGMGAVKMQVDSIKSWARESVQELRMAMQEGRSFGRVENTVAKAAEPVKEAIKEAAKATVAKVEESVARAEAATAEIVNKSQETAAAVATDSVSKAKEVAKDTATGADKTEKIEKKEKLPLGFKKSVD